MARAAVFLAAAISSALQLGTSMRVWFRWKFTVDEVELEGTPDVVNLRCIAASVTEALRTPNSVAHKGTLLSGTPQG